MVRWVASFVGALAAMAAAAGTAAGQSLLAVDPSTVATLAFRPGAPNEVLLAAYDNQHRLQAHLLRIAADGQLSLLRTLPGTFTAAAWLDDGHIVTANGQNILQNWPSTGEPSQIAAVADPVGGIGVAPRSRTLALRLRQTLRLLSVDGRPNGPTLALGLPARDGETCPPDGIETTPAFAPEEQLIALSGLCGDLRVLGRDGSRLMHVEVSRPFVKRHAFSADGHTLLVIYASGGDLWPVTAGRLGRPRALADADIADIAALPDGGFVVLAADRVRFLGADGAPMRPEATVPGARKVAVSADGTRIAVAGSEGLVILDANGRRAVRKPFADFGAPLAAATLGPQFASVSRNGHLHLWNAEGAEAQAAVSVWDAGALATRGPVRLFTSPNGKLVGVLAPTGQFDIFDGAGKPVGRPLRFPGPTGGATALLDDRVLRPLPDGSGFIAFGLDGRVLARINASATQKPAPVALAANARAIATYSDSQLKLWTIDGQLIRSHALDGEPAMPGATMALGADGRTAVLYSESGGLRIWRVGDRDSLEARAGTFGALLDDGRLVYSSKGRLLVDPPAGGLPLDVAGDVDRVEAVTPDGGAALVSKNGVTRLVKIADRR
ncbi:MAG TPA: hypothetical protein VMI56_23705 [Reyranella sp.]|nr:hypothetical protein [Reyranella sp.]